MTGVQTCALPISVVEAAESAGAQGAGGGAVKPFEATLQVWFSAESACSPYSTYASSSETNSKLVFIEFNWSVTNLPLSEIIPTS